MQANKPEFIGFQLSILVRGDGPQSKEILSFLESNDFRYNFQEEMAHLIQEKLRAGKVPFEEVIINLSTAPARAEPVEAPRPPDRPSGLGRLFGRKK